MNWITVFLGIIAVAEVGGLILNATNRAFREANELLSRQLERERELYNDYRKQLEKDIVASKDSANLWAKKYFELEILLKKAEHNEQHQGTDTPRD